MFLAVRELFSTKGGDEVLTNLDTKTLHTDYEYVRSRHLLHRLTISSGSLLRVI